MESGFRCVWRDENRSIQDTLELVERHFGLKQGSGHTDR